MAFGKLKKWLEGAVAQVNPLDNGRTFQTVQQKGSNYTPKPAASVVHQITHNGATNVVGDYVAKPLIRGSMALNQGIGNLERKALHMPSLNADQYMKQTGISGLDKFSGYKGTKQQIVGDAITNVSNIAIPGSSKLVTGAFKSVTPKVIPKIIPTAVANSGVGAVAGAVNNVGTQFSNDRIHNVKDFGQAVKQGAQAGALFGGAGTLAAPVISKGVKVAVPGAQKAAQALSLDTPEIRQLKAQKQASVEAFHNSNPKMAKAHAENVRNLDQQIQAIQQGGYVRISKEDPLKALKQEAPKSIDELANDPLFNNTQNVPPANAFQDILPSKTRPNSIKEVVNGGGNPLYHDTNAKGVLGILDSGEIRPSQAPFSQIAGQGKRVSTTRNFDNYSRYHNSPYRFVIDEGKTGQKSIPDNRQEFESIFNKPVKSNAIHALAIDTTNPAIIADAQNGKLVQVLAKAKEKGINVEPFEGKVLPNEYSNNEIQQLAKQAFTDLYNQAHKNKLGLTKLNEGGYVRIGKTKNVQPNNPIDAIKAESKRFGYDKGYSEEGQIANTVDELMREQNAVREVGIPLIDKYQSKLDGTKSIEQLMTPSELKAYKAAQIKSDKADKLLMDYFDAKKRAKANPQTVEPPVLPKTETASPPLPPAKVSTQTMTPPPNGPKVNIGELPPGKTKATRFASKTVPESNVVSEPVKGSIKAPEYSPQTERQGYANSLSRLQKEGDKTFENNVFANLEKKPGTISRQEAIDATTHAQLLDSKGDDASIRKATQIYEKLSEHYTAAGQTVQVAAIMSRRTPAGMKGWAISTLKKEGVKPSTELQRQITDLAQQKNFTDLADLVSKNVPSSTADKIINFWRAGLLTAPTTTGGNLLGNSGEAAVRKGFVNPVATAADVVMGKFTGKRTMTLAKPGEAGSGFIQGAKEFGKGVDGAKYDVPKRTNYDTKVIDGYVNGVYRLMGVADTPFSGAAEREALSSIAKAEAINKGLKGKAKDQFVKEFMAKPSEQAIARAKQEADYAVFKNPTALGKVAAGAKRPAGAVGDFFIPFTQVPAAIATRIVERTPIGIANQVVKQIKHIKTGGEFDQRAMSQAIGNGLFGPAIMGAGYALAQNGQLTFGYPTDKKERALWDAEGKQPYSVRVGDRWYSLNYLQPFGTLLSVGGQAADAAKKGKNVQQIVAQGVATAGQSVANQSFLKGISGALDAITDPERSVQKYVEQTTSSVVPNFIRSGARAADPIQRKPEGIVEGVKSGIPGLRQQTTPKYNEITGAPLPAKDTFANQYLNPLKPSKVKGDQVTSELARLQSTENGVIPTQYNKSALGKNNKLTDKQVQDLQSSITPQVNKEWSNLIKSQEYQQSSDEDKAKMLKKVSEQVSAQGKTDFSNKNKISYTPSTSSGQINSKIDPHSQKVLKEYYTLSQERKDQKAYGENDYDYKVIKAKYDNDLANNKLSKKEKVTRLEAVKKAEVGSKYSKDVRDFYSLNKNDLWDYLSTEEQGQDKQKLANDILAYDKSLKAAGLISKLKFGSGFASSSGGRKGGRKGKGITLSGADLSANDAPKSVGIKIGNKRAPGTSMRVPKGIRVAKAKPVKLGGGKIRKVSV